MIFTNPLNKIFSQQSKIKLLRFLVQHRGEFTGREIAKSVGLAHPTVHSALSDLREQGIILMRKSGNALLYSLNPRHRVTKDIIVPVFRKESQLKEKMARSLITKLNFPLESVVLFGSIAQKKEKPTSDIDILVILSNRLDPEKAESEIISQGIKFVEEFGNQLSPVIMNLHDFLTRLENKDKLLSKILDQGQVIYGKSITELISHAKARRSN